MPDAENNLRILINDVSVSYTDRGLEKAHVIIFIHGFPFNKSMWEKQVAVLKENYRIITYDIRGHGDSESGKMPFSIDLFVKDLICFMDSLNINRASVCALSMGGYIALNAIEKYPNRFVSLVLSDTQCLTDSPDAKKKRFEAIETIKNGYVEEYAAESVKKLFATNSFETKNAEIASVKEMILSTSPQSLCNALLALALRHETCGKLPEINSPVLILVGGEDKITPVVSARLLHDKIRNSELHIIENTGHLCCLENPDEFNDHLISFFGKVYS